MSWLKYFRRLEVKKYLLMPIMGAVVSSLLYSLGMTVCWAGDFSEDDEINYLKKIGFENLFEVEVTSVSRKSEKLSDAAAAVFVVDNEDILRSGATSIPEVLRMVPGLEVARIDANKWAITSRGFNGRFANKLLVLIDGRTVYTPLFSGVFWDMKDTLLEDVGRIEVIRGPGSTLWGANAVNGVINIITKHTKGSQGGLVTAGTGTEEKGFGSIRYGGNIGQDTHYRVYAKYFDRDSGVYASKKDAADEWDVLRVGFRMDWQGSERNSLILQGDIYDGETGETVITKSLDPDEKPVFNSKNDTTGANLHGRWKHSISETSEMILQLYYYRSEQKSSMLERTHDTYDIDFQHQFVLSDRHDIVWGVGYRRIDDNIGGTFYTSWEPDSRGDDLLSGFVQDSITLAEDVLRLTLGSKFEYNEYTDFEIQPNVRLIWTPEERHSIWAAVSRAVRTPSRAEHDGRINVMVIPVGDPQNPFPVPLVVSLFSDEDFKSEDLVAYELGYRVLPTDQLSLDVAMFYNAYDKLRTIEPGNPFLENTPLPPHFVLPSTADNKMEGKTYGVELAVDWRTFDWWRLQGAYTYLHMQLSLDGNSRDTTSESAEGESPHHQISLRSSMDLVRNLELDLWVRYVENLPSQGVGSYVTLDARLGWKPHKNLEVSIVGQNLLDSYHLEFEPEIIDIFPTELERSVYGKIKWQF